VALLAVNLLIPQVARIPATLDAVRHARWQWLPAIAVAAAGSYLMAAVALLGAAARRLPLGRSWVVQIASAFTNRVLPAGLGGMATNVRYLEAAGTPRAAAVTAVSVQSAAGFLVHLIAVLVIVPVVSSTNVHLRFSGPDLPDNWPYLIGSIGFLTVTGLLRWGSLLRRHLGPPLGSAVAGLAAVVRKPSALAALFGGCTGVTLCYALALTAACRAFSLDLPISTVAAVFLSASAVGAVAPTPGGLGAIEAALVAGLVAAGAPAAPGVAAVLTYRLITYWLPLLPGVIAYRRLRRREVL
jgi:undecaprenyl-diphosphatase